VQAIGPAPAGHKYVLVDGDLLLIAEATGTVVDAVLDFGGVPAKT